MKSNPYANPVFHHLRFVLTSLLVACFLSVVGYAQTDPLPSWNEGKAKSSIINFIRESTDKSSSNYVDPKERIATFDQDGTLWVEHPFYSQMAFVLDRIRSIVSNHSSWGNEEPFKSIIDSDAKAISKFNKNDWAKIISVASTGITTVEFHKMVSEWLKDARHRRFNRAYTDLVYQPMLEVINFLKAYGFKVFIVTGGDQEFVRVFSEKTYGIPTEQVVGSSFATRYEYKDSGPVLMIEPKLFLHNDYSGKPVGINLLIGKRPFASFGNSDGDQQMLEWTGSGDRLRLMMLVLHDDPEREYAYGPANGLPDTKMGRFSEKLLSEATSQGWHVISMKKDWKVIFPFDLK